MQLALYIDGYKHEAIQNPISENNIGAPLAPQKAIEQISSRLYEHIMACPREGDDEVPPVTTPSVAALVDPLLQGPALRNLTQVDTLSPSATPSLPRLIATVNAKYTEVSSKEICRQELKTAQEVLQKYPGS